MADRASETTKCQRTGCEHTAAGRLAVLVLGEGGSTDPARCIRASVGVHVCADHFKEEQSDVGRWLSEPFRRAVTAMARGKARPDFDRAFLELERMQ